MGVTSELANRYHQKNEDGKFLDSAQRVAVGMRWNEKGEVGEQSGRW